jgi:beta-lactamase regulating signal transducer with metallopeptidase domain
MMNQATSIIAEALLYSLLAGGVAYIVLRVLLALLKNIPSLIKYHLCNISLLIPLLIFIVSLTELTTIKDTAPVYPTTPPLTTIYNNTQDYAALVQEVTAQESRLTAEVVWAEVNSVIVEHSYTITWLYIAGLLLFSIRLLLQYLQSRQLKTKGLLPATDDWYRLLANTKNRLRINSPIHISFTERKISPCIIGHAKAVILIPISLANHLTTEQAEAILLHELAHYKQYDHYINVGVQCIKCLLFFNPFVWLQAIMIDKYRELSCDETAAKHERNIELAETLAMIAGIQARQNSLVMSLKKRSPLLARVQALLSMRQYDKSSHRLLPLVVTTIVLATGLLIAGSTKLFSTEKDNLREQLKEISAQMYKEGNHKYIFVDAVLDSLLTLPAKADVLYMGSQYFSMMGNYGQVKMSGEQHERYKKKLQLFLLYVDEDKETPVTFDAIKGKGALTMQEILNKESAFRTCTAEERYRAGISKQGWKKVFAELVQDKLVQPGVKNFSMEYSGKGIVINGWKLEGVQETKYASMLREVVGIDLQKVSGSLSPDDMRKYLGLSGKNNIEDINTLAEVSRLLFAEGKIEYILADAMKDGYLRDGDEFTIVMNGDDVQFAGIKMTKEQEAQYNDKYRLFREYYVCPDCHGGVTATVNYSDFTNQNSALREGDFLLTVNSNMRQEKTMQLIGEMHEEGLIDKNYKVEIFYIGELFSVNKKILSEAEAKKYIKLLKKYSLTEKNKKGEDTWSIIMNQEKPYPPSSLARVDYKQFRILPKKEKAQVLEYISNELFNKGLTDYIMVDAVKDGYLKDGERYHIEYKDGIVTIKEKTLSINDQIAYNKKLETFTRLFESDGWYGNTRSTVKLADILDPHSSLWTRERTTYTTKREQPFSTTIMSEMSNDGLINMAYQVKIECTDSTISVNNKKLTGAAYEKYSALYKRAYPGKGEKCSNTVQFNTDRPFPPDDKTGINISEQQRLSKVSDELFRKGHQGFIIAELVKDGYIKKGERYKVEYENGKFSIEGKTLPAEVIKSYEEKMAKFTSAHPSTATVWWSLDDTYDATNAADEFNLKLGGGTPSDYEKEQKEKERDENFKKMIQAMHDDELLDVKSYYLVEYKEDGVFVNAIKLTGGKARKYTEWLNAMGYTAGKGMLTESVPDGVKIPDRKMGISTISMPVHGTNLPAIAQVMFVDGNPNFILAYALHDGVLRERQDYNFRFTGGETYFNDKLLPAPYQAKYTKLMKDFMQAHGHKSDKYITRGDGVTKKQLNTPESPIRKYRINKGRNEKGEYYVDQVIKMMAKDGLIDTTQKHTMEYNARGLFVNGKKLSDKEAAKYEPILKEGYGRSPRWTASDGISYSNEP